MRLTYFQFRDVHDEHGTLHCAKASSRAVRMSAAALRVELPSSTRHATEIGAGAEIGPALLELVPATPASPGLGSAAESHRPGGATATMPLIEAVLQQSRLDSLAACDANVTSYDPDSFLMIFRCRGRQMPFVIKPLLVLMAWNVMWALLFARFDHIREIVLPLEDLITPLLTPVSFLLVFRLGRAAVR